MRRNERDSGIDAPPPKPIDPELAAAAAAFGRDLGEPVSVGGRPHMIRIETGDGPIRVRRWPVGSAPIRITFVNRVRAALAAAGMDGLPTPVPTSDGSPTVVRADRVYEAQRWLPGRPASRWSDALSAEGRAIHVPSAFPTGGLTQAGELVARWHEATLALCALPSPPAAPLRAVLGTVRQRWSADRALLRPVAASQAHIQRWVKAGEQAFDAIEAALAPADFLAANPTVVAHLALWPGHLLFSHSGGADRVTGILDPSEAAVSTPLLDIADLITHGGGWSADAAEEALSAYASVRSLSPEERRLLPAVSAIGLIAETGRMLGLAYAPSSDRNSAVAEGARTAAAALLQSLETVIPAIKRSTEAGPLFNKRAWVRRPIPPGARGKGPAAPPKPTAAPPRNAAPRRSGPNRSKPTPNEG